MRPEAPRGIFGEILGTTPKLWGAPKKTARASTKSAAGFGPETPLARLSPAISLILSGVSQNEASFGKKTRARRRSRKIAPEAPRGAPREDPPQI